MKNVRELTKIKKEPDKFTQGELIKFHEMGPFTILEYHPWKRNKSGLGELRGKPNRRKKVFRPYVNRIDTCYIWPSLEKALVFALAWKHEGRGCNAHQYITKILKIR